MPPQFIVIPNYLSSLPDLFGKGTGGEGPHGVEILCRLHYLSFSEKWCVNVGSINSKSLRSFTHFRETYYCCEPSLRKRVQDDNFVVGSCSFTNAAVVLLCSLHRRRQGEISQTI